MLKLKCDKPHSTSAFKFNLRRYIVGVKPQNLVVVVGRC